MAHKEQTPPQGWVSVEDKLPPLNEAGNSKPVFIRFTQDDLCDKFGYDVDMYLFGGWGIEADEKAQKKHLKVTHWMAIPICPQR